jgi:nicotinamidase-related amidase
MKNSDLHGFVPDNSPVALILLDVINDLEFEEGEQLLPAALAMAREIQQLRQVCYEKGIPVIYVNDNFGRWQSNLDMLVTHCLEDNVTGKPMVEMLQPGSNDYFVLKPKHSGFFSTTLDTLLRYLQCKRLIITGLSGNICVLFTASDAYMRDFELIVPADCTASNTQEDNEYALRHMERILKADIRPWRESVAALQIPSDRIKVHQ